MIYALVKNGKIARLIEDKTHTMLDFETAKAKRATEEKYNGVNFVLLDELSKEQMARAILANQRAGDVLLRVEDLLSRFQDELADIFQILEVDDG